MSQLVLTLPLFKEDTKRRCLSTLLPGLRALGHFMAAATAAPSGSDNTMIAITTTATTVTAIVDDNEGLVLVLDAAVSLLVGHLLILLTHKHSPTLHRSDE